MVVSCRNLNDWLTIPVLLPCLVLGLLFGVEVSANPQPFPSTDKYRFDIYLSGNEIGSDTFTFEQIGKDTFVVNRSLRMDITLYYIYNYSYEHNYRGIWSSGSIRRFRATTNHDGSISRVQAKRMDTGTVVSGPDTRYVTTKTWLPTSWWNPDVVEASNLINVQTGALETVESTLTGRDDLNLPYGSVTSKHYKIKGDVSLDLWFNSDDELVKLAYNYRGRKFIHRRTK